MANNKIFRNDELQVRVSNSDPALLSLHNISNGSGAGINFTDHASESQLGYIRFFHSDGSSQGGGASFHITSTEQDTVLVIGTNTETARIAVKSANSNSEVDYGFYSDTNTGMYSPAAGQVGLVSDGSRKLLVNNNGVYINNGNFYIPDHAIYAGNYIYHDGDTDTFIHFDSDKIRFDAGGQHLLQIREGFVSRHTGVHSPTGGITAQNLAGANMIKKGTDIAVSSGQREEVTFFDSTKVQAHVSTGTGNTSQCYNWYSSENVPVDPEKDYEFSVWVKSTGDHNLYVGWHEYNSSGTKISSNPYFHTSTLNTSASNINSVNGWVKLHYRLKSHRTTSAQADTAGTDRYADNDSQLLESTTSNSDGVMHSACAYVHIRMGTCYGNSNTTKSYFYNPQITEAVYDYGQQQVFTSVAKIEKRASIGDAPITPNSNFNELLISSDSHTGISIFSGTTSTHGAIYFGDPTSNSAGQLKYLHDSNAMTFATNNNSVSLTLDSSRNATFGSGLYIPDYIYHDGDTNSYFGFQNNDEYRIVIAGGEKLHVNASRIRAAADILPAAENSYDLGSSSLRWEDLYVDDGFIRNAYIDEYIYHNGDTDTYIRFETDTIKLRTAGSDIATITSTGTTLAGIGSSGNAFVVNRGSNGDTVLRVQNSGEVVVQNNYFYAAASGVSMYVQNTAVFRGSIVNDGGDVTVGDNLNVTGNLSVTGDLNITGDINSTSVTDLDVVDKTITIAKGSADSATADGAGIVVDGASASLLYDHSGTQWEFNKTVETDGNLLPKSDAVNTLGGSSKRWNFAYINNALTVTDGNINSSNVFDFNQGGTFNGPITSETGVLNLDDNGDADGVINAKASLTINIDSDGNSTGELFRVQSNTTSANNNPLFKIDEDGDVTIQGVGADTRLVIDDGATGQAITLQSSGSGEGFIKFTDAQINRTGGDLNFWTNNLDQEFSTDNGSTVLLRLDTSDVATFSTTQGSGSVSLKMTPAFQRMRLHWNDTGVDFLGYNGSTMWLITNSTTSSFVMGHSWDWDRQVTWRYTAGTSGASNGIMKLGQFDKNHTNFTHGQTEFYTGNGTSSNLVMKLDKNKKTTLTGDLELSSDSTTINHGAGTTNSQPRLFIGEQSKYGVAWRWDSGSNIEFDGFWNSAITGSRNRDLGSINVNTLRWELNDNVFVGSALGVNVSSINSGIELHVGGDGYFTGEIKVGTIASDYISSSANITLRPGSTGGVQAQTKYLEVGNDIANASNDGTWDARFNVAGVSHARIDVTQRTGDDIQSTWYVHNGHGEARFGTLSSHGLKFLIGNSTYMTVNTSKDTIMAGDLAINATANTASAPLYITGTSRGNWNDGIVLDESSGWAAVVYKRSNTPKMFHGLYNGSDNFIYMSSNYSNSGTQLSAPRSDAIMRIRPDNDTVEYYLPVHFGQKLHLHDGVELQAGTTPNVDQTKSFNMTFQLSANTWTDTGIDGTDLATGTYVMQVFIDDHNAGGGHYDEYYSGIISWFNGSTNSTNVDEIVIHRAGHASNNSDVQFRTERASGSDSHDLMLQVKQNFAHSTTMNNTDGRRFNFKFRRLM